MATHVTSRAFQLPTLRAEMHGSMWFNLWQKRLWPYNELQPGDELWWYESVTSTLRWVTRVTQVEAFPYTDRDAALDYLDEAFHDEIDRTQEYLDGKPQEGYCLGYSVDVIRSVNSRKPASVVKFNQSGWERGDRPEIAAWLAATPL